ncbi:MAG TPA: protoporphyrinogen oxidase [Thermoanaerobaculia bacterium]|nr:protoporphyrinogen oxidase [Thermoanaerobaculia bacterium]
MPNPTRIVVVGGGISGLAAAWHLCRFAERTGRPLEVCVVERGPRFGGRIGSERHGGFLVETGPDSFLARKTETAELAGELGLGDRLVPTAPERRRVWIVRHGRLVEIPPDMGSVLPCRLAPIFASELLSWRGKLRLSLDLALPRRRAAGDESLGAFLRRRFGRETVESLTGPLLAGIYMSEPETLSLAATFPHLADIERRHGSVIRGLRAAARQAGAAHGGHPGRGGHDGPRDPHAHSARVSLAGGVGELVEALAAALGQRAAARPARVNLRTGCGATEVVPTAGGWSVRLDDRSSLAADTVVLACPAFAAADAVRPAAPRLAAALREVHHVSTAVVTLGLRTADLSRPLDGYGFVVPAGEGRHITACTWSSAKFEGRAADGTALVRAFLGGPRGAHLMAREDAELVALARHDLAELMGLEAEPLLALVHRHERGTPRYDVGHRERVAAMEAAAPPGLHLAGAAYGGIGIPDCIRSGRQAAERALAEVDRPC